MKMDQVTMRTTVTTGGSVRKIERTIQIYDTPTSTFLESEDIFN